MKDLRLESTLFICLLSLSFILGQFARFQFGNGVAILGIDFVVGIFAFYWSVKAFWQRKKNSSFLLKPLLLFLSVGLISLVSNLTWLEPEETVISSLYILRFAAYAGIYFLVRDFSESEKKQLKKSLLFVSGLVVAIGIFQYVFYDNLGNLYYLEWDDHMYRLFSVFLDPNFTSVLFVLFFLYSAQFLRHLTSMSVIRRMAAVLISYATLVSILLTFSRTGLIMLVGGGLTYLLLLKNRILTIAFIGIILFIFVFSINTTIEGLNPFRTVSTKARIESYQIALDIFSKHPILGVGFNAYRYAQNEYGFRTSGKWQTSHADAGTDNSFLFVLATTGIVGFSAYLYLWFVILRFARKKMKSGSELAKVTFVSIISLFIGAFFLNVLFYPFIMVWVWILVALTENEGRKSR